MESMVNVQEGFNKQVQNMSDTYEQQKQEMSEEFDYRVGKMNQSYETLTMKVHQPHQSIHSGFSSFFALWIVLMFSVLVVTIILRIRNKRKQEKAREEYKKYDEEMHRAYKANAGIPDKEIIKAQTADRFKYGISELLNSGDF